MLNLASNHIEADTIMYIHIKDCLSSDPNIDHVIINSPDTDVLVLGIRFWVEFEKKLGCKGLWRVGTGDRRREFGLHIAATCLGKNLCNVLPAIHATSKISTKKTVFKYLKEDINSYQMLLSLCDLPISHDRNQFTN